MLSAAQRVTANRAFRPPQPGRRGPDNAAKQIQEFYGQLPASKLQGIDRRYGNEGTDSLDTEDARRGNDAARGGAGADSCATDPRDARSYC